MWSWIGRVLDHPMKLAEVIGALILIGIPYGIVGLVWSLTHTEHLANIHGTDRVVSFLGSIVCWPVLIFSNVTMT